MNWRDYGIRIDPNGPVEQKTTCPKCSHTRKKPHERCLSVNVAKGVWNCHHCGWSESLNHFERKPVEITPLPKAKRPKQEALDEKVVQYFADRKIPKDVLERNHVVSAVQYVPHIAKERNCIGFEFRVDGEPVNIKWRDAEKNFFLVKGAPKVFYGLDDIADSDEVIICEGEVDKLSFEVAGYRNCISVPNGATVTAANARAKLEYLDTCIDRLEHVERFVLATDDDAPGQRLREELARRLGKDRCWVIDFPDGCKDANDALVTHNEDVLRECVETAQPYPMEGSFSMGDFALDVMRIHREGYPELTGSGDVAIDRLVRFAPGTLTVVTGIPNHGKSTWLDCLLVHHMVRNDWRVSFFTPENYPVTVHAQRLIEQVVGKPMLPTARLQMTTDEMVAAHEFLSERVYYVEPNDDSFEIDQILSVIAHQVRCFGVNAAAIDPWNRIEHHIANNETETIYTGRVLHKLQAFARLHNICLFLVAHPRKMPITEDGRTRVPGLYDIMGSSHFVNMPDNGLAVYRRVNPETGETEGNEVHVKKVKHTFYGELGVAHYRYDRTCQRFLPVDPATGYCERDTYSMLNMKLHTPDTIEPLEEEPF